MSLVVSPLIPSSILNFLFINKNMMLIKLLEELSYQWLRGKVPSFCFMYFILHVLHWLSCSFCSVPCSLLLCLCISCQLTEMFRVLSCSVVSSSLRPHGLSQPGSSVHGSFQARILDWVAISYSRESWPRDRTCVSCGFFYCWATWKIWVTLVPFRKIDWLNKYT